MKMRELEERTGVHREVIRLYLRNRLIPEPDRPKRTVAIYGEHHVQAITTVRKLQHESRLTLPQIKSLMEGAGSNSRVDSGALDHLEQLVAHQDGEDVGPVMIDVLLERYPHALEDARILASIGIVTILQGPDGEALSLSDAEMVRVWGEMRRAGFDARLGYTPDVLGFYVEAADFVGKWEASTFLERIEGKISAEEAAGLIRHALPLMLNFFGVLRQRAFFRHFESLRAKPDNT